MHVDSYSGKRIVVPTSYCMKIYALMKIHKFDRDANVSYAKLMRKAFEATVNLVRVMERELGKEKAHEILYMNRVEGDLAMVARDKGPAADPDLRRLQKANEGTPRERVRVKPFHHQLPH
jgi:hypothetical protein